MTLQQKLQALSPEMRAKVEAEVAEIKLAIANGNHKPFPPFGDSHGRLTMPRDGVGGG